MSDIVIFDSSVLVGYLRAGEHSGKLDAITGIIRNSSVVLAELWRGAATTAEHEFLRTLERNHATLTPTTQIWLESGELLGKMDRG